MTAVIDRRRAVARVLGLLRQTDIAAADRKATAERLVAQGIHPTVIAAAGRSVEVPVSTDCLCPPGRPCTCTAESIDIEDE